MRLSMALVCLCLTVAPEAASDALDDYVRAQMNARHVPGLSLAVVKDGRIARAGGYGVASLELEAPASNRTVYEIGSISKQIAADAILLLRDDGKLRLDHRLSQYIDDLPEAWAPLTIRHVLTHTGGLPDFDTGNIGFSYRREYTTREFVGLVGAKPLAFRPGERWNYTNGFPLLGFVVERVTGRPYADFVRARIFTPLGLTSARFKVASDVVPHRADGYLWRNGGYQRGEPLRPQAIAANGGVMMNVRDFAAWDIAMTSGKLLSAASVAEMATPTRLNDGTTVSHGLGWFMDTFNGHRFGAHWGSTVTGHSAVIRRYDAGVTVIVLSNLDDGGLAVDAISKRAADLFLPGTANQGLERGPDPDATETAALRKTLAAVAAGEETGGAAPGLGPRLPQAVRDRIAGSAGPSTVSFESLGQERLTPYHFNLDPAVVRVRRYRATTSAGIRYVTVRLSASGIVHGVLVEDE